jgi:predicted Zn finger-like uncharacterized protein
MRIVCPACAATYEVPDRLIGTGRNVRCSRCSEQWVPSSALEAEGAERLGQSAAPDPSLGGSPAPPTPSTTTAIAERRLLPQPETQFARLIEPTHERAQQIRLPLLTAAGWLSTAIVLGVLSWAAVSWRNDVMRVWPPSERVYAALGLQG